ncbi:MAG: hypothetical protein AMXMBFR53_38950 [Gemmatimonadota bacterium]
MKVAVIGSGYVGLVLGACLAESGNDVVSADIDESKVDRLNRGEVPIYEPGLEPLIERNLAAGRIRYTTDVAGAVRASDIVFIAVGTPPGEDGSADLKHVLAVARTIGQNMNGEKIVITKSTVPVGTADKVRAEIEAHTDQKVHVCSNPEFLKEGAAVDDFMKPDRVVLGVDSEYAGEVLRDLYEPFVRSSGAILLMDVPSAEITKYAANAMLATRISFMNAIAQLCEKTGADVHMVRKGVGSDARIGQAFLYAGAGYGGSCFVGCETVLARREGRATLVRLDDLFEDCVIAPDSAPGDLEPEVAWSDDLAVVSWHPDRGPEWRWASAVTRRWYEGEVLEVRTKMGRRVRCTPDHPFVVSDGIGGEPVVKLAGELTERDWVPVAMGEPGGEPETPAGVVEATTELAWGGEATVASAVAAPATPLTGWDVLEALHPIPFRGWVYSLEVPGNETFVTTGGLVVHNCFPKDVKALTRTMAELGADASILQAVEDVNERQKRLLLDRLVARLGEDLTGRTVAVWGLSFKPNTDDMREAPSLVTIDGLLERGARVVAHDPVAMDEARRHLGERITYASSNYAALDGADALVIHTEWQPYRRPDFPRMKAALKAPLVFDGRNLWDPADMAEAGFEYHCIGRRAVAPKGA